jgi:hypothetical protein
MILGLSLYVLGFAFGKLFIVPTFSTRF